MLTTTMATSESYLPNDCWECVFKFLDNGNYNNSYLKPLSLVSKQFLSITNKLRSTLAIFERNPTTLFHRFSNGTSLDLEFNYNDMDTLLQEISCFPLKLTSLKLFNQPTIPERGLRVFSQKITTLTSFKCYRVTSLRSSDLSLISNCFPLLEELDLGKPVKFIDRSNFLNAIKRLSLTLVKLRKINLTGHDYINNQSLFHLFKNCKLLEDVTMSSIERMSVENSNALMDFGVSWPQLKSLHLGCWSWLTDERITMFASIFPNLRLLDFSDYLSYSSRVKLHRMNFEFSKLEVLKLSYTHVDDETLYVISKSRGLLQLSLENCDYVTEKGVKHVGENCTQLREINLKDCLNINGAVLASLMFSRPSSRKITAPHRIVFC